MPGRQCRGRRLAGVHTCTGQSVLAMGTRAYRHMPESAHYRDALRTLGNMARWCLWYDMVGYLYPPIVCVL